MSNINKNTPKQYNDQRKQRVKHEKVEHPEKKKKKPEKNVQKMIKILIEKCIGIPAIEIQEIQEKQTEMQK